MAPSLKLIVRAGAGVQHDRRQGRDRARHHVANCPGKNAIAVAELAFGLILALDRRIPDNVADLRAGKWNKKEYSKARGLYGATLGLLGVGSIGREVIERAAAFGMPVVLWSRRFDGSDRPLSATEAARTGPRGSPRTGCRSRSRRRRRTSRRGADVLSIHLALGPTRRHS